MVDSIRLGLRAQIILALCLVFLISFALLGLAAVQLTRRASEVQRTQSAKLVARTMAATFDDLGVRDEFAMRSIVEDFGRHVDIEAVQLRRPDGKVFRIGSAADWDETRVVSDDRKPRSVSAPLSNGGKLSVWLAVIPESDDPPLTNLLVFYVSMTGVAVLLLTYVSLTNLIVRPLDRLTRSSQQIASGKHVRVPEHGAAEVAQLAGAFNDMAAQLRAERISLEERFKQLEETTIELRTTQQQLIHGEKLASVGRLAAGVAHEIGNPLAAILGLVEHLRAGDVPEQEATEFLTRIQGETERINRIIRDLLDFSRLEKDPGVPDQTASLQQGIDDAVNLVKPQKQSRDIEFDVNIGEGVVRVMGPQHRITQVVLNLLLNAVDALEGKGRIGVSATTTDDGGVLLTIQDDGPGIPVDMLDHLFEPFTTTKPVGKGTGLGLAVCHALVEGMGGTVTADNAPEGGARMRVRLRSAVGFVSRPPPAPGA